MADIHIYSAGLCYLSVCVPNDMAREEVEAAVNREHPTGISSQWELSAKATFRNGETNPCPCNTLPETRTHYLLDC